MRKKHPYRPLWPTLLAAGAVLLRCAAAALAAPTVDFSEDNGKATQISPTLFQLNMSLVNNMDTEPASGPYNDYVSENKIEGIYSATVPFFTNLWSGWGGGVDGYTSIHLSDPVKRLWSMTAGTTNIDSRVEPGDFKAFNINLTHPTGIPGSAIRYGAVAAQGKTNIHDYQPYNPPDTFIVTDGGGTGIYRSVSEIPM